MDFIVLAYYNFSFEQLDSLQPEFPDDVNATQFFNDIFYQINIDFNLSIYIEIEPHVYEHIYLEEGHNTDFGVNIMLEKVLTFWAGNCYKITFDLDTFQKVRLW